MKKRGISLFAGIGGADIALEALGCETVAFSEIDPYAKAVFAKRFPEATDFGSIADFTLSEGDCDILVGGFPCQDISNAGKRAGIEGARSSLWGEYARLIGEARPALVLIENVQALLRRGIDRVLADLHALGYACEWDCIPAAAVGAPHLRDRIWMVAYPEDREPLRVFAEWDRLLTKLDSPPAKWPRGGRMEQGFVFVHDPVAPRKTKRLGNGWSTWAGVDLVSPCHRGALLPTPSATSYGSNRGGAAGRCGPVRHSLESMARHGLWPTPMAGDGKSARNSTATRHRIPPMGIHAGHTLTDAASRDAAGHWPISPTEAVKLWPSPTRADGTGGPGRSPSRTGGDNLRTAVGGRLNPDWVEWLMGFPVGWTDLECFGPQVLGWEADPHPHVRRVAVDIVKRKDRLTCLGNALVPQVMHWVAGRALEKL